MNLHLCGITVHLWVPTTVEHIEMLCLRGGVVITRISVASAHGICASSRFSGSTESFQLVAATPVECSGVAWSVGSDSASCGRTFDM